MFRTRTNSHNNCNFSPQQSLTAYGGAPFAQGSLGSYHAFGLFEKSEFHQYFSSDFGINSLQ